MKSAWEVGARLLNRHQNVAAAFAGAGHGAYATVAPAAAAQSATTQASPVASTSSRNAGVDLGIGSRQLTPASVGRYYRLDMATLPEASRAYHQAFYAPHSGDAGRERRGGCKALQAEAEASGRPSVMYRPVMHQLWEAVAGGRHKRLMMTGPAGSGKSVALAALVERARANGWLVLYVPSATALVRGGYFFRRPGSQGQGQAWDTPTSAQQMLKGMADAHGRQLKDMPASGAAAGSTLMDVVTRGMAADDNAPLAVDSCLELCAQLVAVSNTRPVLFALDEYGSLHGASDYGVLAGPPKLGRRRALPADQLTLASGMRLLSSADTQAAQVVAATTSSHSLPTVKPLQIPRSRDTHTLAVPSLSLAETAHALAHYHECGLAPQPPTAALVKQLHALTCGNAKQLRQLVYKTSLLQANCYL